MNHLNYYYDIEKCETVFTYKDQEITQEEIVVTFLICFATFCVFISAMNVDSYELLYVKNLRDFCLSKF